MNQVATPTADLADPQASKAARNTLTTLSSQSGGIVFQTVAEARDVAYLMAGSSLAVRKHLRNDPGACFGIVIQAVEWGMSPYSVANKSYVVNDQLAYESQLIQAVILRRAPIKGRIKFAYEGEGEDRVCIASATLLDGDTVEYRSPRFGKINPKNSPLWKSDPDQQQAYFSGRSLCRRHFPDVLMGIYDVDELEGSAGVMRDVTPKAPTGLADRLAEQKPQGGFSAAGVAETLGTKVNWADASSAIAALDAGKLPDGYELKEGVLIVPAELSARNFRGSSVITGYFSEIVTTDGEVLKTKAKAEPDPDFTRAGAQAFSDGEERKAPEDFTAEQSAWWLQGFDEAKAAKAGAP